MTPTPIEAFALAAAGLAASGAVATVASYGWLSATRRWADA